MTRRQKRITEVIALHETHGATQPDAESRLIVAELIVLLARSTTPIRWRTFRSWVFGISVREIARRDGVPRATVYNRLRAARADFAAAIAREVIKRR